MKYALNLICLACFSSLLLACHADTQQTSSDASVPSDRAQTTTRQQGRAVKKTILFFGNSLTAGYGLDDPANAFPGLIDKKLDSLGYDFQVINAGLSGETTASGKNRLTWVLDRQPVAIFVLELGANDGLRGISPEETRKNLEAIIRQVKSTYPEAKILLTGMMVPPNMGKAYSDQFRKVFPEIAQKENVALLPFLLQDVAGEPSLNQSDGIHPTAEGNQIVAKNVWKVLKNMLPAV